MALSGLDNGSHVCNACIGASLRAIGCRVTNLVPEWLCPVKARRWGPGYTGCIEFVPLLLCQYVIYTLYDWLSGAIDPKYANRPFIVSVEFQNVEMTQYFVKQKVAPGLLEIIDAGRI